jgi:TolB-like protein/tetratricopeptide (TPR) repeat protein
VVAGIAALALLAAIPVIRRAASSSSTASPAPASSTDLTAIAVLPFANLSPDVANEYFSDGLGEDLINALGGVSGLRVAPRTSSWIFKGRNIDVRAVGESLDVAAVVEGSVRRAGDALRITARLVRAADARTLWSGTFDERQVTDVFAIQDSIARAIVQHVAAQIAPIATTVEAPATSPAGTRNFEAHDLYLRGTFERNRRSPESIRRAIDLFHQTLELDSTHVRGWIGLAESYAVAGFYDHMPPARAFPAARRAAEAALRFDPSAGMAHATLGYVALYHDWDLPQAEREFLRAIELNPEYAVAHQWYANMLTAAGRYDAAREHWRHAQDREPLATIMVAGAGWSEYYAGRPEESVTLQLRALERDSIFALSHYWLGLALESLGRRDEAIRSFRHSAALAGFGPLALTGVALAHAGAGRRDSALAVLHTLEQRRQREYVPPFEVATVYAALGDRSRALDLLQRAVDEKSHSIALLAVDPRLRSLSGEPRFRAIHARIRQ